LESNDGIFHILNRGITISARSSDYNNSTGTLDLDIPDGEETYGILDGGHTYKVVKELAASSERVDAQFVKFEILTGVEAILPSIASARNFSKQVKDISLAHYSHKLDWLKTAMGPVAEKVRWSENDEPPFDVMEYIQVLAAFDIKRFTETNHPLESYKNSGNCLGYATDGTLKYLAPVVGDVIKLYDTIRYEWWQKYKLPGEDGVSGRPGRLKVVQDRKRGTSKLLQFPSLPDANRVEAQYHVEKGLVIPLIAAFRFLLDRDSHDQPTWRTDPFVFWETHGAALVRKIMDASDQRSSNPQAVGRDKTVYEALHESVELLYLKSAR
jgi:hypothetical protein